MSQPTSNTAGRAKAGPLIQEQFPDVVISKITTAPAHPLFNYQGFKPGRTVLSKGYTKAEGFRAFAVDTVFDRDLAITVRDGARLYTDIFRPASSDTESVPAILPWSPYGKTGTGPQNYDFMAPFRAAIPKGRTSGYEKFEAPDPAEWTERGYAMINIDARGAGHSDGIIAHWGNQEAQDIWDVIDWLSQQPWCNGSVVMAGNSWLAISQINFTSRMSHPALKAIAPWESYTDPYRHFTARGGRPHIPGFHKIIAGGFAGPEGVENIVAMLTLHPLYDDYWEAKRIPVENINNIPLYVLASYSSMLHTNGSFQTFREAKTTRKWLRVHPYQEWYDLYRDDINDELQRYFDHYAKGVQNGWEENTPPVRLSLLGFDHASPAKTVLERPEKRYPLERQQLTTFYLDASTSSLHKVNPTNEASVQYEAHHLSDSADFRLFFDADVELAGPSLATVFMSTPDSTDMDIVVQIRKINSNGEPLKHLNYPCHVPEPEVPDLNVAKTLGPQGFLRASHAISIDRSLSASEVEPFYTHRVRQPIEPKGTIVRLEIPIWPIGMVFAAGEGIMLRISGHDMCLPETELCRLTEPEDENVGVHVLYTGGQYPSSLTIPVIPA
ncbi:uncharacterized protein A1O9_09272 [Exophiala aquamarina CBS 119918]|uniref:Xaa-Pro dipeptidyl-peptidase C-terminal domain-containing protein n=1 Tax=Exophiala aquamarina CBS 119918 TaxID=1182545 RepID=A0A072PH43_9EURO|nr:uncharacterized protein A1O9_09272 [Exophiala aquamarina CBS 119918]KEF54830.1 hypothetical protein A1O9_09272 [Exophiala aquamarina CBS 119918]